MNPYGAVVFSVRSPRDTRVKTACEQVGCEFWRNGWESHTDESTADGRIQADFIRRYSGRTFTEHRSGTITVFRFASGQRCFEDHWTLPERFLERTVRAGRLVAEPRRHSAAGWVDSMDTHLHRLREVLG